MNALSLAQRLAALLLLGSLAACSPPEPATPRATAAPIIEITSAPTQDVDATATAYASKLVPTPTPAGLYKVQQGDTLGAIAEQFGTSVEEVMAANGITDPNAVQAGQLLIIPSLISNTVPLETAAPGAPTGTAAASTPTVAGQTPSPASP
jgi:LysM repeat protein